MREYATEDMLDKALTEIHTFVNENLVGKGYSQLTLILFDQRFKEVFGNTMPEVVFFWNDKLYINFEDKVSVINYKLSFNQGIETHNGDLARVNTLRLDLTRQDFSKDYDLQNLNENGIGYLREALRYFNICMWKVGFKEKKE